MTCARAEASPWRRKTCACFSMGAMCPMGVEARTEIGLQTGWRRDSGRNSERGLASTAHRRLMSGVRAPCNSLRVKTLHRSLGRLPLSRHPVRHREMAVEGQTERMTMQLFRTNPAARQVPPRTFHAPSEAFLFARSPQAALLARIDRYLEITGEAPSRLGRRLANDPALIFQARQGRALRPDLIAKLEEILASMEARHG